MTIASGNVVVDKEELEKLFGLPKGVELYDVKINSFGEFIFNVISPEVVRGVTHVSQDSHNLVRSVSLKRLAFLKKENESIQSLKKESE